MDHATSKSRSTQTSPVTEWNDGKLRQTDDVLVGEQPLLIQVANQSLTVTMRTPGDDEELAAGFLFTEGIIHSRDEIVSITPGESSESEGFSVTVELTPDAMSRAHAPKRNFVANSGCGMCGKSSLADVYTPGIKPLNSEFRIEPNVLCTFPEMIRNQQLLFGKTGGLHAAALFDVNGVLLALREDVGRHNAVDKVVGWALMRGLVPLSESVLLASGRGGFEIIQKSLMAGIPVLASVSAASSLAVAMAREMGMTLVGFLRGRRFIVYCGEERLGINQDVPSAEERKNSAPTLNGTQN